jgi:hypothetical protein
MALTKVNHRMIEGASVNVRDFGAVGDGVTDDQAAIMTCIEYAQDNGIEVVRIPKSSAPYMIRVDETAGDPTNSYGEHIAGIFIYLVGIHLKMDIGAELKALPRVSTSNRAIIQVEAASNTTISGGTLNGQRFTDTNLKITGMLTKNSPNIRVMDVTIKNCKGDGFSFYSSRGNDSIDSYATNVKVIDCGYSGLSIGGGYNTYVTGCEFSGMDVGLPMCGIDIEPEGTDNIAREIVISECLFRENEYAGIIFGGGKGGKNIIIDSNLLVSKSGSGIIGLGGSTNPITTGTVISNNTIYLGNTDPSAIGIQISKQDGCVVTGNNIYSDAIPVWPKYNQGIYLDTLITNSTFSNNVIRNMSYGFRVVGIDNHDLSVVSNKIEDCDNLYSSGVTDNLNLSNNSFTRGKYAAVLTSGTNIKCSDNTIDTVENNGFRLNITDSLVSGNIISNYGTVNDWQPGLTLDTAENCFITGNTFLGQNSSSPAINETNTPTLPSVISNNFARHANLATAFNVDATTILSNNFTT